MTTQERAAFEAATHHEIATTEARNATRRLASILERLEAGQTPNHNDAVNLEQTIGAMTRAIIRLSVYEGLAR